MTRNISRLLLKDIAASIGLAPEVADRVAFRGNDRLPSCFPVTQLAAATIGAACRAVADLLEADGLSLPVAVDHRLASLWFRFSIRPQGWTLPAAWDAIAGDYRARDGWIKLHTNAAHHKRAALAVLGCSATREMVAEAVAGWTSDALEQEIVTAGGCAARLRGRAAWESHPQGRAVSREPLILCDMGSSGNDRRWRPDRDRPLAGLCVLDLTRILAGPVATRFLAGWGAQVLRIDPPGWEEPVMAPDVTPGKRCARLDLQDPGDRATFERLLSRADILVHGYRADALDHLGYDADARQVIRPGLVDVSLDAYGHSGPWARRRGFDSLVQFSSGIAANGMTWRGSEAPVSLPVQALDHATGYLMAAAAMRGVAARRRGERTTQFRLSLARTAELLFAYEGDYGGDAPGDAGFGDFSGVQETTAWGPALRLRPPATIGDIAMHWASPAVPLGSGRAEWTD
ncbi:L-carnitine dehydratase [Gluconacetobacter sacchari DSM 12717]|uniref:Acyl-CoA transferase n=3 Tax=Gluconacetobacter sacchari TaxID=92759 RepID=A0A7W4IGR8_9PROT|nr:acyl-CoA transferase [Gluconacetobacter sacchari]GBQ20254.1 L-carnitine dehydratase [Gluconacetobacter sacchari DSM 12717]